MRMISLVNQILSRTQNRILEQIDLSKIANQTPGELSRTLETWTGVVSRQDARNRLSLDFDMLRIQALQDVQGLPPVPVRVDVSGMRPESLEIVRAERAAAKVMRPVEVSIYPGETPVIVDGRHRLQVATERGDKTISTLTRTYDHSGNVVSVRTSNQPIEGGVLKLETPSLIPVIEKIAMDVASINARNLTVLTGINVRATSGLGARIDMFRDTNVSLIKSLVGNQIDDIQKLLESSEATGLRVEELRSQIMDRFGVSKSKADLLARDQTLKLNANITQARQRGAGVERYVWTTSGDERVREEHADLEGQVFSWDDPPAPGHPGEDYQCRCTAFPLIEEFDGAEGVVGSALEDE